MKITKAVIPAAGLGTRMLPAAKAIPKEMVPIVDKPSLQYIVEEAVASGIEDILIITNRGKDALVNHFDRDPELEFALSKSGKTDLLQDVINVTTLARVHYIRQQETHGLGHAVLQAKAFIGNEPFAVLYGDDVIMGNPACGELCEAFEKYNCPIVGINPVPWEEISKFSSLKLEPVTERVYRVLDMIEKPKQGAEFSNFSILGRCILTPEIFPILEQTAPGVAGEIQLTDAMKTLMQQQGMMGVHFTGKRYDIGSKLGFVIANVERALSHPEIGEEFKEYLKELSQKFFS